ncbi:hypothetical protein AB832_07535 [Flavobacteriaceae bacterium (ex Bugula neritina AB1)]|nr:hypothetical protein AB832_07535 [Flavobacteriaceae bacterium (ex Bugula neritina AB1)]
MVLEREIERYVCNYARTRGLIHYKFNSYGCRGVPDRVFLWNGTVFFIEFKTLKGVLSIPQTRQISLIRRQGIRVYIIRTKEEGKELIDKYVE